MSYQCLNKKRRLFFKKDSAKAFSGITKIIFDFDGVLVQTSQSYRQTIRKVVDYYFLKILGLKGEEGKLVTLGDVQKFKDTGLYNNDWNLSYAVITYYLALLMRKLQKHALQDFTKRFSGIQFTELRSFLQILGEVGAFLRRYGINATELVSMKNDGALGMESFLAQASIKNENRLETTPVPSFPKIESDELTLIRKLVPYRLEKPDLLKRLFEESYLGEELFNKFYGVPSIFKFTESFLEKEAFIPTKKTLDALRLSFGKFAIYSEKPRVQGMYLLEKNDFKEYFEEKGAIFLEDLVEPKMSDESIGFGKPNPTLFIELIETFVGRGNWVAYVGDGIADVLLVENARLKGVSNILFLGVLCSSKYPNKLLSQYMEHEADAIMTDINDIPNLLTNLGGKK